MQCQVLFGYVNLVIKSNIIMRGVLHRIDKLDETMYSIKSGLKILAKSVTQKINDKFSPISCNS